MLDKMLIKVFKILDLGAVPGDQAFTSMAIPPDKHMLATNEQDLVLSAFEQSVGVH